MRYFLQFQSNTVLYESQVQTFFLPLQVHHQLQLAMEVNFFQGKLNLASTDWIASNKSVAFVVSCKGTRSRSCSVISNPDDTPLIKIASCAVLLMSVLSSTASEKLQISEQSV